MVGKKAQLKIQQMAFMLMAVTLFFVLVGLFVLSVKFSSLREDASLLQEKNAMLLVSKLANSPEFSCGDSFGSKIDCVDLDKVMVLKQNIAKYSGFWDVENIEVRKIYPAEQEVLCSMGNYPACNVVRLKSGEVSGTYVSNFVSLCRKENLEGEVYDKCEIGRLMVSYDKN